MKVEIILAIVLINLKRAQTTKNGTDIPTQDTGNETGMPTAHKEALDKMIDTFLNDQDTDGSIFQYLFGVGNEKPSSTDFDNLDIATLDSDSLKKIVRGAKRRYEQLETRRKLTYLPKLSKEVSPLNIEYRYLEHNKGGLQHRRDLVIIAFDHMAQSIYTTRYRLIETAQYRRKYSRFVPYQIGAMVGAIMELKNKMGQMYATMQFFETRTHFFWYLMLYEKMLSSFTDITQHVERIFIVHKKFVMEGRKNQNKEQKSTKNKKKS